MYAVTANSDYSIADEKVVETSSNIPKEKKQRKTNRFALTKS